MKQKSHGNGFVIASLNDNIALFGNFVAILKNVTYK